MCPPHQVVAAFPVREKFDASISYWVEYVKDAFELTPDGFLNPFETCEDVYVEEKAAQAAALATADGSSDDGSSDDSSSDGRRLSAHPSSGPISGAISGTVEAPSTRSHRRLAGRGGAAGGAVSVSGGGTAQLTRAGANLRWTEAGVPPRTDQARIGFENLGGGFLAWVVCGGLAVVHSLWKTRTARRLRDTMRNTAISAAISTTVRDTMRDTAITMGAIDVVGGLRGGQEGQQGKEGRDGREGKEGKEGEEGRDGREGKEGKEGEEGRDGRDGGIGEQSSYPISCTTHWGNDHWGGIGQPLSGAREPRSDPITAAPTANDVAPKSDSGGSSDTAGMPQDAAATSPPYPFPNPLPTGGDQREVLRMMQVLAEKIDDMEQVQLRCWGAVLGDERGTS